MNRDDDRRRALLEALTRVIVAKADLLTELDQAIGDGDHGINMKRGFEAVAADSETLARQPWPDFFKSIGTILVMKVGGASGPLYGTIFLTLGKTLPVSPTASDVVHACRAAIEAVQARGKSGPGQKTMLDVLLPVVTAMEGGNLDPASLARIADEAAAATKPMRAIRGRASFLGDRSIGHVDPGAGSSALMIGALKDVWGM